MKRSYKQNCAVAHAMDRVGERWTLLIVRDLLTGAKRYGELAENLPGIGTNLLATRLKELVAYGLIEKSDGGYRLTRQGEMLEPVVHALVRFALAMNVAPGEGYLHLSDWDAVALKALYRPECDQGLKGRYLFELDDVPFCIDKSDSRLTVTRGGCEDPAATISLHKNTGQAISMGEMTLEAALDSGGLKVSGPALEIERLLSAFGISSHDTTT